MRKQIMPWIMVFCTAMLDTTIISRLVQGPYMVSVTMLCTMSIALLMGQMHGMLFGLFGGILLDVTAGTLGERLIPMIVICYLLGLLVHESDPRRLREITRRRMAVRRFVYSTGFTLAAEFAVLFYQYFNTATFEWVYIANCCIRAFIYGAGVLVCIPVAKRLISGKSTVQTVKKHAPEVKFF